MHDEDVKEPDAVRKLRRSGALEEYLTPAEAAEILDLLASPVESREPDGWTTEAGLAQLRERGNLVIHRSREGPSYTVPVCIGSPAPSEQGEAREGPEPDGWRSHVVPVLRSMDRGEWYQVRTHIYVQEDGGVVLDGYAIYPTGSIERSYVADRGEPRHPIQPLVKDDAGTVRFKANAIVKHLLEAGKFDMNDLALTPFDDADREQFAQLIGYSLSGFGELSYVSDETYDAAEHMAEGDGAGPMERSEAREGREPDGVSLIAAERRRQVEVEGWTPGHDDEHTDGSMALVGAIYALPLRRYSAPFPAGQVEINLASALWPKGWARHWYKPTPDDRVRELVKAGALIAAEIDRLNRATPDTESDHG